MKIDPNTFPPNDEADDVEQGGKRQFEWMCQHFPDEMAIFIDKLKTGGVATNHYLYGNCGCIFGTVLLTVADEVNARHLLPDGYELMAGHAGGSATGLADRMHAIDERLGVVVEILTRGGLSFTDLEIVLMGDCNTHAPTLLWPVQPPGDDHVSLYKYTVDLFVRWHEESKKEAKST